MQGVPCLFLAPLRGLECTVDGLSNAIHLLYALRPCLQFEPEFSRQSSLATPMGSIPLSFHHACSSPV